MEARDGNIFGGKNCGVYKKGLTSGREVFVSRLCCGMPQDESLKTSSQVAFIKKYLLSILNLFFVVQNLILNERNLVDAK